MEILKRLFLKTRIEYIRYSGKFRKFFIRNKDFTIISNNCWGGWIYRSYQLSYKSPTIGLFFMAEDYIKFISNLPHYIKSNLKFTSFDESIWKDRLMSHEYEKKFPIGKLDDIEIMFMHYKSEEEAYQKWTKRCKRINWNKILVKFNDQNYCTENHIIRFENLPYKNKICFTSKKYEGFKSVIYINRTRKQDFVKTEQEPFGYSPYINMNKFLDRMVKTNIDDYNYVYSNNNID